MVLILRPRYISILMSLFSSEVLAQSLPSATESTPSATQSGPTPTTPFIVLPNLGTAEACATTRLLWQLRNVDAAQYTVTLRAYNSGIDQAITGTNRLSPSAASSSASVAPAPSRSTPSSSSATPSSTSTTSRQSAVAAPPIKRTPLNVNKTIGTSPGNYGYTWKIVLPEGQYMLVASVPELGVSQSAPMTILEGDDTACLANFIPVSPGGTPIASSPTRTSTVPSGPLPNAESGKGGGGFSTGAIVGVVMGILTVGMIVGLLVFCMMKRKKRAAAGGGEKVYKEKKGSGLCTKAISRPHRIPSDTDSSLNPFTMTPSGKTAAPADSAPIQKPTVAVLPRSQRGSVSSIGTASYKSFSDSPRIPESGRADDPFTSPPTSSSSHMRSHPISPPARPESEVDPTIRRASIPKTIAGYNDFMPLSTSSAAGTLASSGTATPSSTISRSRSNSRPPMTSTPGGAKSLSRKNSTKRKPVPSLEPDLRKELDGGSKRSSGGKEEKKEFKLIPDMPSPAVLPPGARQQ